MLLFSTILRINEKLTLEDFIRLVIEWNQTSSSKYPMERRTKYFLPI